MTILKIITVLISIESGGRINAINVKENAVGVLQIRPIMVKEVNRICKLNGEDCVFENSERLSRGFSIRMAIVFLTYQRERYVKKFGREPSDLELACSWQSGGIFNKASESYKSELIKKGLR